MNVSFVTSGTVATAFPLDLTAADIAAKRTNGFDVADGVTVTLTGLVANAPGAGIAPDQPVTKTGNGALILANAGDRFTGRTTVSGGSLELGDATRSVTLAGNATLAGGNLAVDNGSLGSGTIDNQGSGLVVGFTTTGTATAGSATIANGGVLAFQNTGSGGTAVITNVGVVDFSGTSNAGSARITSQTPAAGFSVLQFRDQASAGQATIIGELGASLTFADQSTAGSATITTRSGAANDGSGTVFQGAAQGGTSRQIVEAGGLLDVSQMGTGALTIGSLEGAGLVSLGFTTLTVGADNRSTIFSGTIGNPGLAGPDGNGGITKVGTGTLALNGATPISGRRPYRRVRWRSAPAARSVPPP